MTFFSNTPDIQNIKIPICWEKEHSSFKNTLLQFFSHPFLSLWIIWIVPLISLTPYFYAPYAQHDLIFNGCFHNARDQNVYFNYLQQIQEGHFLLKNLCTDIPHEREYFHLLFLILGLIIRWTHLPIIVVYTAAKYILAVLFGLSFRALLYQLPLSPICINIGVFLGIFSGGFAAFRRLYALFLGGDGINRESMYPGDISIPETHAWSSYFYSPQHIWSFWIILTIYLNLWNGEKKESTIRFVLASLCLFALTFSHTYHLLPMAPVTLALFLLFRVQGHPLSLKILCGYTFFALTGILSTAYQYNLFLHNPGLKIWKELNITLTPSLWVVILSYGILCFGYIEMGIRFWNYHRMPLIEKFLGWWLILQTTSIYLPVAFNRRFLTGLAIPLIAFCILSLQKSWRKRNLGFICVFLLVAILSPINRMHYAFQIAQKGDPEYYYSHPEYQAYIKLNELTNDNSITLADLTISNRILPFVRGAVTTGQPTQAPVHVQQAIEQAFRPHSGSLKQLLLERKASHLIITRNENALCVEDDPSLLLQLIKAFENQEFIIYKTGR